MDLFLNNDLILSLAALFTGWRLEADCQLPTAN
jgi:hypothetical protein